MKIAVDASILEPPCPTGVERAAAGIVGALGGVLTESDKGDEVFVLSRGTLPTPPPRHPRIHARVLGGPSPQLVWRETHLAPALSDLGVDVLWSPVTAIPLGTNVPRVATFHEAPWLVRPGMEGFLRERAHALRLRIAVETAARIVCPSEATAAQLRALHPGAAELVRVVPHGIDERFLAPRSDDSNSAAAVRRESLGVPARYLLQVGGNRARKNVPHLLRAFARYRLRGGKCDLVLAGPGPSPDRAPRGVTALGWIDDASLLALYDGAQAVVVASESEGFGLPVLEAAARGAPVVACASGGVVEAAGDAALLVPPGDEEALASALLSVENDAATAASLVERGRSRAAGFRWATAAARLVAVLRESIPD